MSEEWGPWIEHDGKGCPCVGQWVQACLISTDYFSRSQGGAKEKTSEGIAGKSPWNWDWTKAGKLMPNGKVATKIIRYRIRKPRGLTILEELLENLPAPTSPKVDA